MKKILISIGILAAVVILFTADNGQVANAHTGGDVASSSGCWVVMLPKINNDDVRLYNGKILFLGSQWGNSSVLISRTSHDFALDTYFKPTLGGKIAFAENYGYETKINGGYAVYHEIALPEGMSGIYFLRAAIKGSYGEVLSREKKIIIN